MVPQGRPLPCLSSQVQLINDAYGLVVDAVLGPGVEPREVGGPCTRALATLKLLSIPLVSLDVPSGMPGGGGCVRAWETRGPHVLHLLLPWLICLLQASVSPAWMDVHSGYGRGSPVPLR